MWSEQLEDHEDNDNNHEDTDTTHAEHPEKKVEWIELLFDLVFVVIIAQISELSLKSVESTLTSSEQHRINCGSTAHHRRLTTHGKNGTATTTHPLPFNLSPAWEEAGSTVIYFMLAFRVWAREAQLFSSRKGGLDVVGRILCLLLIFTYAGSATGMAKGVGSHEHFLIVVSNYALSRTLQLLDYVRLAYYSTKIRQHGIQFGCVVHGVEIVLMGLSLVLYFAASEEVGIVVLLVAFMQGYFVVGIKHLYYRQTTSETTDIVHNHALDAIHVHHYSERWGLAIIIVIGEGFAQVIHSINGEQLEGNNLQLTRLPRVVGTFLAFTILIPFFWLYFDSMDPNTLASKSVAQVQTAHAVLLLSMPILASALSAVLKVWLCGLVLADAAISVPVALQFFLSVPFGIGTLARGIIQHASFELSYQEHWSMQRRVCCCCTLRCNAWYNGLRCVLFLCLPLLCGLHSVHPGSLLGVGSVLSLLQVGIDVYGQYRSDRERGRGVVATEELINPAHGAVVMVGLVESRVGVEGKDL